MINADAEIFAALALQKAGRLKDAECAYRAILCRRPRDADALHLLGLVVHQLGANQAAEDLIRQAIAIAPRKAVYHANLGVVLIQMNMMTDATKALRAAVRQDPSDFGAQSNLSVALSGTGDQDGAIKAAGTALRLRPGNAEVLANRRDFLEKAGLFTQALVQLDADIKAHGGSSTTYLARGGLLLVVGRTAESLAALDKAIHLGSDELPARQARIGVMHYLPAVTMQQIGEVTRRLASVVPAGPSTPAINVNRTLQRPLRIGYVSGDFRNHPVSYFLHAVLAARDRADAVVICYDNAFGEDTMTVRLKSIVDEWRTIAALTDEQAASFIRSDRIDILVDLAGHTKRNRFSMFANRAAPVQAAWLGYFGTTGAANMDFVIADRHVLPPADEPTFTESVVRLPDSYLCFSPPAEAGPVTVLPGGLYQPITFGCFNNRAKLNPEVFAVWARLLVAVPGSRLLLKSAQYNDKSVIREISKILGAAGVAAERILFEAGSPIAEMFEAYGRVDIALDPFPFAGGATTAQALWMGVPVVSLAGQTWTGRQGKSLLTAAGFPEWAVANTDDYIVLAQRLASDRAALIALRASLREAVAGSPLCQASRFARNLQRAYRYMWFGSGGPDCIG